MTRQAASGSLRAAFESCALSDRSDLGRLLATGPDILDLLHRLSTADVKGLEPGEGKPTVLTSSKGRIVERLFLHHLGPAGVLLAGGSGSAERVTAHLKRYTFAEQTGLTDGGESLFQFTLAGPRAAELLEAAGLAIPATHGAVASTLGRTACHVLGQDGLGSDGFSVVGQAANADAVWAGLDRGLAGVDGAVADVATMEAYRVLSGLPCSGHELTEEYNPLEAGLWDAVDFDKGCYVGQEVVARLRTYDKVSRSIVGLELPPGAPLPPPGAAISAGGRPVGRLTSAVLPPGWDHPVALGYVKRRELRPDVELLVNGEAGAIPARYVELPFPAAR